MSHNIPWKFPWLELLCLHELLSFQQCRQFLVAASQDFSPGGGRQYPVKPQVETRKKWWNCWKMWRCLEKNGRILDILMLHYLDSCYLRFRMVTQKSWEVYKNIVVTIGSSRKLHICRKGSWKNPCVFSLCFEYDLFHPWSMIRLQHRGTVSNWKLPCRCRALRCSDSAGRNFGGQGSMSFAQQFQIMLV